MTHQVALPAYYNDLDASFAEAWNVVAAGVTDRNSPAHTPTVGTVDADGTPQLRIMILRAVSRDLRSLRFHTDARSDKTAQLQDKAAASVLVYDPAAKAQAESDLRNSLLQWDKTQTDINAVEAAKLLEMDVHCEFGLPQGLDMQASEERQIFLGHEVSRCLKKNS